MLEEERRRALENLIHESEESGLYDKPRPTDLAERLREIRERAQDATPGPWRADSWSRCRCNVNAYSDAAPGRYLIASLDYADGPGDDADFIAHAREDIPWLLDRLSALESAASQREKNVAYVAFCIKSALDNGEKPVQDVTLENWLDYLEGRTNAPGPGETWSDVAQPNDAKKVDANITVNGNEHLVEGRTISYEQVAILARRPGSKELTMTYHRRGGFHGILHPGERIPLRDGTHFCAVVTGDA